MQGYVSAGGGRFAVASGCAYATAAAAEILERGGNVVDAALAGSAVLCVTLPHAVSIGGDLFALIKLAERPEVVAVNATGGAPRRADRSAFVSRGLKLIPARGPLSIQPPGLAAGWATMVERWASLPLAELLEPAIDLARNGFKVGPRLARLCQELASTYAAEPGWSQTYLIDGKPLQEGDILRQDRLSATMARLGREGARRSMADRLPRTSWARCNAPAACSSWAIWNACRRIRRRHFARAWVNSRSPPSRRFPKASCSCGHFGCCRKPLPGPRRRSRNFGRSPRQRLVLPFQSGCIFSAMPTTRARARNACSRATCR